MNKTLDEDIKTDVVKQLRWYARVDASKISVKVDEGEVTLDGTVPTVQAKFSAADDALNVAGVTSVVNELDVSLAEIHESEDEVIQDSVENTLSWNPDISAFDIDIEVDNAWVTLEGTVDALWKKFLAEEKTKDVVGVIGVTNKLAVASDLDVTDQVVAEDIVSALDRDARVIAERVNVEVDDGDVVLSGTHTMNSTQINHDILTQLPIS